MEFMIMFSLQLQLQDGQQLPLVAIPESLEKAAAKVAAELGPATSEEVMKARAELQSCSRGAFDFI